MSFQNSLFSRAISKASSLKSRMNSNIIQKALYSSIKNPSIVFDIDGVLVKGDHTLEEGKKALKYLNGENPFGAKIPFVFMTNSGGISEKQKADELSTRLHTDISPDQVILSHSPMRQLASELDEKNVLVIGGEGNRCAEIAASYGFKHVITPQDIHCFDPYLWQFNKPVLPTYLPKSKVDAISQLHISAILMFHDTYNYGRDLQIVLDVLRCRDGKIHNEFSNTGTQSVPVWVSNQDFHFSNETINPRFAQGAFHECLKALFKASTGNDLRYTAFGKPHKVQYDYAENVLSNWVAGNSNAFAYRQGLKMAHTDIYAIGDNPASDIAGANSYGWNSVLVRTGVYVENPNKPLTVSPTHIADHVYDAVRLIVESNHQ